MTGSGWKFLAAAALGALASVSSSRAADSLPELVCDKARSAAYEARPTLEARPTTIVAIGSSSTEGIAKNARNQLYPAMLQAKLQERWPQADVKVINKGRGGEVMADTLKRFEADVLALKPSLVVWQLGVNDVLRFDGVEGRREEIKAGLKMLAERNIPVILLDLQYAPLVVRDPDSASMQELIDGAAREGVRGRVTHFRRFAIMKSLNDKEAVPMAAMTDADGLHMTDAMHACVGRLLADMIVAGVDVNAVKVGQQATAKP
jgi:acyl-CoA thioesterase I